MEMTEESINWQESEMRANLQKPEKNWKKSEENANLQETAESARSAAASAKCNSANKLEDLLSLLEECRKFERNDLSVTLECKRAPDLDTETQEIIFELCKKNMQAMYEASSWGWDENEKREEMFAENAWYIYASDPEKNIVAFVHFRFDVHDDKEVVYCWEIQLNDRVRRKGLGKFLMETLELLAYKTDMLKVVLTVFKHNEDAKRFYMEGLGYEFDECSPEDDDDEYCYYILSKCIKKEAVGPNCCS